jgi:hypothetical protein
LESFHRLAAFLATRTQDFPEVDDNRDIYLDHTNREIPGEQV